MILHTLYQNKYRFYKRKKKIGKKKFHTLKPTIYEHRTSPNGPVIKYINTR